VGAEATDYFGIMTKMAEKRRSGLFKNFQDFNKKGFENEPVEYSNNVVYN
jgi:hypothetical protein